MNSPKLVEFETSDGLVLPGLLYESKDSKKAVIYLHGNGSTSIFYDQAEHSDLPEALNKVGVSLLKFNNRGANLIKKFTIGEERKSFGMAFEKIKECVPDIDAAISFLKGHGYNEFYLAGASTGANKICVYNHYKPENEVKKYILISGGDDTGIYYSILGPNNFSKFLKMSNDKINEGKGTEIFRELLDYDLIFSYQGFYDIANPDGDYNCFPYSEVLNNIKLSTKPLFRYFAEIDKPSLIIYGDHDEASWQNPDGVINILKKYKPDLNYQIIKGADHRFTGKKNELTKIIAEWLNKS